MLTLLAVYSYYSCRVAALGGDLKSRLHDVEQRTQVLKTIDSAAKLAQSEYQTNLKALTDKTKQQTKLKIDDANLSTSKHLVEEAKKKIEHFDQNREEAVKMVEKANQEIARTELWPACLAATLGTLGACTYLLYRLIGAYAQARMTITSLYSELLRLPIGTIVGWILYVAFCQEAFRSSFLTESQTLDVASQSLLLLPFVAGYSSRLVVELLNRVIDGVRTTIGLKPTEVQA